MASPQPSDTASASQRSLLVGRHDGHVGGHLNCVALRHGWTRTFSIPSSELEDLDYDTLENILEVHTLKLRPMGVRIYVENPADSGNWSKIRPWKNDTSLQSTLVREFFQHRRTEGILTRIEVRDGADRTAEGDNISLRSVGSKIISLRRPTDQSDANASRTSLNTARNSRTSRRQSIANWLGFGNTSKSKKAASPSGSGASGADAGGNGAAIPEEELQLLEPAQKSFLPSILSFFRPAPPPPPPTPPKETQSPEERQKAEEEIMRKRGWLPPGLRKNRSLRETLRYSGNNPFLSGGGSGGSLKRFNKKKEKENADPFADEHANAHEITDADIDEFFELERSESMPDDAVDYQARGPLDKNGKPWSPFRPQKVDKKSKKKKGKGKLSNGVEIVARPQDAFPTPPPETEA